MIDAIIPRPEHAWSPPGGAIALRVLSENGEVRAEIADAGKRPPGMAEAGDDGIMARLTPSVLGLALSQRLANAMNARLTFSSGPGEQTVACLVLPEFRDGGQELRRPDQASR